MYNKNTLLKPAGWLFSILVVGAIILTFARPFRISGNCMEPAVKDGSLQFLNRALPYFRRYKINDIVIFKYEKKTWISRIVALEQDTLFIHDGNMYVNDVLLQDAIARNWTDWKYGTYGIDAPIQVPLGHVYVLSDNLSAHHDDSRVFGPIPTTSIVGIIW